MPWQKKPSAPDYVDTLQTFVSQITGTDDSWLLGWTQYLDDTRIDVNEFCSKGPPPPVQFTPLDFATAALSRGWVGVGLTLLGLHDKINLFFENRAFGAFCELSHPAGVSCTLSTTASIDLHQGGARQLVDWTPLPAGTTKMRFTLLSSDTGHLDTSTYIYNDSSYLGQIQDAHIEVGSYHDIPQTIGGATRYACNFNNDTAHTFTVQISTCVDVAAGADPFTPDPVVQPPSAILPTPKVYNSIADLGAELDQLEGKLHQTLSMLMLLASYTDFPPALPDEPPIAVEPDAPIAVKDAGGVIVTLATVPSWADENFGTPVRLHRIGRIDFGSDVAWHTSVEITHTPMLVQPLPLGTTRIQVNTSPAVSATVTVLKKVK